MPILPGEQDLPAHMEGFAVDAGPAEPRCRDAENRMAEARDSLNEARSHFRVRPPDWRTNSVAWTVWMPQQLQKALPARMAKRCMAAGIVIAADGRPFPVAPDQSGAEAVLTALRTGQYGETPLRAWLREQWLDAEAHSDNAAEAGDDAAGVGYARRARAFAASYHAVAADTEAAALDSVYEARNMARPRDQVDAIVSGILDSGPR